MGTVRPAGAHCGQGSQSSSALLRFMRSESYHDSERSSGVANAGGCSTTRGMKAKGELLRRVWASTGCRPGEAKTTLDDGGLPAGGRRRTAAMGRRPCSIWWGPTAGEERAPWLAKPNAPVSGCQAGSPPQVITVRFSSSSRQTTPLEEAEATIPLHARVPPSAQNVTANHVPSGFSVTL